MLNDADNSVSTALPPAPRASLRADDRGVAAVEFALILPLMIGLYFGCAELTQGIMADRKMTLVARALTDLVSQQPAGTSLTDTTMSSIFAASTAIMAPYSTSSLQMTVSAVDFVVNSAATASNGYDAKIRWSKVGPNGGTQRACAKLTPVSSTASPSPTTLVSNIYGSGSLIIADVSYQYTPRFGGFALAWASSGGSINMRFTNYMKPRNWTTYITYPTASTGTCTTY